MLSLGLKYQSTNISPHCEALKENKVDVKDFENIKDNLATTYQLRNGETQGIFA